MKKFLLKTFHFLGVVIVSLVMMITCFPKSKSHYNYIHHVKMERLDTLSSPRLILIGGSNVAFGINSKMLRDSLNFNVVNTASQASIGMKFMIDEVEKRSHRGDIIVVMPEYEQFFGRLNGSGDGALTSTIILSDYNGIDQLNYSQWINFIAGIPNYVKSNLMSHKSGSEKYSSLRFNEFGDEVVHWQCKSKGNIKPSRIREDFDSYAADYLICFMNRMKAKGCQVILLPPISIQSKVSSNQDKIKLLYSEMKMRRHPFGATPEQFVQPDSLAYDTQYHVNYEGAISATQALIDYFHKYN